jgi:hypothetical protein
MTTHALVQKLPPEAWTDADQYGAVEVLMVGSENQVGAWDAGDGIGAGGASVVVSQTVAKGRGLGGNRQAPP